MKVEAITTETWATLKAKNRAPNGCAALVDRLEKGEVLMMRYDTKEERAKTSTSLGLISRSRGFLLDVAEEQGNKLVVAYRRSARVPAPRKPNKKKGAPEGTVPAATPAAATFAGLIVEPLPDAPAPAPAPAPEAPAEPKPVRTRRRAVRVVKTPDNAS